MMAKGATFLFPSRTDFHLAVSTARCLAYAAVPVFVAHCVGWQWGERGGIEGRERNISGLGEWTMGDNCVETILRRSFKMGVNSRKCGISQCFAFVCTRVDGVFAQAKMIELGDV